MEQNLHFGPSETGYSHWCDNQIVIIGTSIVEFARDSFELRNIYWEVYQELKLEELWMEK